MTGFAWPLMIDSVTDEDKQALVDFIMTPGVRFTQSSKVREFELKWSEWLGVKHSVFVNSGSSANYIAAALMRDRIGRDKHVIVPPIGWSSDVASVAAAGLVPVFCDVSLRTLGLSPTATADAIAATDAKGVVIVHVLGFDAWTDDILDHLRNIGVFIVEDCCEAHGATHSGKKLGTFGDVSCFSFYFGHHMTTIEGGMLCTDDDLLHDSMLMYRSHGMVRDCSVKTRESMARGWPDLNPLFTFRVAGFNMRSTELNAVLGLSQLPRLDDAISVRRANLDEWVNGLDPREFIVDYEIAGNSSFALPLITKTQCSPAKLKRITDVLERHCVEYRIGTAGGGNQTKQPYLSDIKHVIHGRYEQLQNADHIHSCGLYVGNHTGLDRATMFSVAADLNKAARDG